MKKVIGEKSKGVIINRGIVFVVLLIVLALPIISVAVGSRTYEVSDLIPFYIFLSFILVIIICVLINMIRISKLPKELIFVEEDTLSIYVQNMYKEIPFMDIIQALPKIATSGRGITYSFGKITIHTKEKSYTVEHVAECERVSLEIMKMIKSNQTHI